MWKKKKKKEMKYLTGPVCGPKVTEQEIKKILQGFDFRMYPKSSLEINDGVQASNNEMQWVFMAA